MGTAYPAVCVNFIVIHFATMVLIMEKVSENEFIDICSRMAEELQGFIDDAQEAGCIDPLPGAKELINVWREIYNRCDTWKQDIVNDTGNGIAALD